MKGAGHNFGIVTSVTSKIYNVAHKDWAWQTFIYSGDRVEALYSLINYHFLKNGTQPIDVQNYSFFFNSPHLHPGRACPTSAFPLASKFTMLKRERRDQYDLFSSTTQKNPALNESMYLFEGYSTQGVKAIDGASSSFAFRDDVILVSPLIIYERAGDKLDHQAADLGRQLRDLMQKASGQHELHAYVKYAYRDETLNMYGYETWGQRKLTLDGALRP